MGGTEQTTPQPQQPQQSQAPPAPSPLDNLVSSLGMAQLLVVGGAALVVVVDLILGILLREYSAPAVAWAGSAALLVAFFASRRPNATMPVSYETVLVVVAVVVALVLARNFVIDLVVFLRPPVGLSALAMLGLVAYAAAGVMMAWGAWQLWRGRR